MNMYEYVALDLLSVGLLSSLARNLTFCVLLAKLYLSFSSFYGIWSFGRSKLVGWGHDLVDKTL